MGKYRKRIEDLGEKIKKLEKQDRTFPDEGEFSLENFVQQIFEPTSFLWEGLIETKSLNMIVGDSGLGKSRVSEELGYCIATGDSFLGKKTKRGRVLLIDAEHTEFKLQERMKSIIERRPADSADFTIISRSSAKKILGERLNLFAFEHRQWLEKKLERNDFVIIDTYSSCAPLDKAGGYEGEHESWKELENWMVDWCEKGKTFLMTHHTNREGKARGTSLIDVNMSTIISLHRTEEIPEKATLAAQMSITKGRDISLEDQSKKILAFFKDSKDWQHDSSKFCGWLLRNLKPKNPS